MTESPSTPFLQARGLTKGFSGVTALSGVSLSVEQGEVHAVIGENGAGKSTLMKILAGVQPQDKGQILIDGVPIVLNGVDQALAQGIALIHQELNLADNLDVGSNIFLGREPTRLGLIDSKKIESQASHFLSMVGLDIDPRTLVETLPIGVQQMVEIAKALSVNARLLIMDEPTSSLSHRETEELFRVIEKLKSQGVTILYISHRLFEIETIADRVTVLRDGENAGILEKDEISHDTMVEAMVGRNISQFYSRKRCEPGETLLEVKELRTLAWPQHAISLEVKAGEMVGIAGLVGAGRTELLRAVFGIDKSESGSVMIADKRFSGHKCRDAISAGMALVPENRKTEGLILEMGTRQNIGLPALDRYRTAGIFANASREREASDQMIREMHIKTPSDWQHVRYLSGGNQQKVVIGKWLSMKPKILLLDEPTRGVDIGAKQEIYRLMEELASEGVAILFVSSEMEEVISMSDRVIVMHEGRISGELAREHASEEAIMHLATGGQVQDFSKTGNIK
ncbi:MAG: sugar ABC transporter ATP-binding protein [Rubripirellula sp.]|nr:sugar ABC transporter ATP-binding protein [Rubripirellula sp.]